MVVGTFRDVTAERFAVQREAALAALSLGLARAGSMADTLREALEELRPLWHARRVLAAVWDRRRQAATCRRRAPSCAVSWQTQWGGTAGSGEDTVGTCASGRR